MKIVSRQKAFSVTFANKSNQNFWDNPNPTNSNPIQIATGMGLAQTPATNQSNTINMGRRIHFRWRGSNRIVRTVFPTFIFILFSLFSSPVFAADEIVLELQTPIIYESVSRGETKLVQVSLSNLGSSTVQVIPSLKSIEDVDDFGQIDISSRSPVWKDWVAFDNNVFEIDASSNREFTFALDVPQAADSGAYYGILSFSAISEDNLNTTGSEIRQSAGVGLVVLLNVIGDNGLFHSGEIQSWEHSGSIGGPHNFELEYQNTGSSIFVPVGLISIRDWRGRLVDTNVLEDHWVLPTKSRNYELTWAPKDSFGIYHAVIEIQNVEDQEFAEVTFVSFTGSGVAILVACILGGITVISFFLKRFLMNVKKT